MKKNIFYITIFSIAVLLTGCDDNEVMPAFQTKGTATQTVASIASSKANPVAGEQITLTMKFVNPSSDPVQQVQLKAKVGAATEYTVVETFTIQSGTDVEVIQTANYVAPGSGTTVVFDMVITSGREYPQVKRTSIKVQ